MPASTLQAVDPVRPDYAGPGVSGLVPALLGVPSSTWLPALVADARVVVLLVIDGLGWDDLDRYRASMPVLTSLEGGPIPTVVPSTTASALTSITTGLAPSQHGLIGFRVRIDGRVLNTLAWRSDGRTPPDPGIVQRREPFRGREVPVLTRSEFRTSGFTMAHLRGGRFVGWRAISGLVEHCRRLAEQGEPLVYAYYPGVDEVAHAHGLIDGFYQAELGFVDRLVGDLLDVMPRSSALLVTSDHGQVHLEADDWLELGPFSELVDACSGDGRFRYLHARRGAAAELLEAARAAHGERAWVLSRAQLLDEGWLGPPPDPNIARRIGDVVLAARGSVAFVDPALPREAHLRSAHGSMTPAEMLVPLLAGRGRAP